MCVCVSRVRHNLQNNSNSMEQGHSYKSLPNACVRQPHHACSLSGLAVLREEVVAWWGKGWRGLTSVTRQTVQPEAPDLCVCVCVWMVV